MNPKRTIVAGTVVLFLCIVSVVSAGYFDILGSDSRQIEYTAEAVTDTPYPDAFLEAGTIKASVVASTDGNVRERINMVPNAAVGQNSLEALRDYCQKNRMLVLLAHLDNMSSAELDTVLAGGNGIEATANVSQREELFGKGNFDDTIVFVDDAFFGMKDGRPCIGITDPFSLQIKERRGVMLTCFDMYAAFYDIDDYCLEGLDERIEKLAELENRAALAPDYSSVSVNHVDDDEVAVVTSIVGRDQLDPQIYEMYLFEVEVVHRTSD